MDKVKAKIHSALEHRGPSEGPSDAMDISDEARGEQILTVFGKTFGELLKGDPQAINTKFRKMAATAFAFYRGSACLFYHDQTKMDLQDPFLNELTSRVWMHGDLHAENFGTYMDSRGSLVFNVNDFDEAYIGPFTWDLKRFAASMALIGYSKALSDEQISELVRCYARAYAERIKQLVSRDREQGRQFTLKTATGPLLTALRSARMQSRAELLDGMSDVKDAERSFSHGGGAFQLDDETREKVVKAFEKYLTTLPSHGERNRTDRRIKDIVGRRGVGIGSAGLPSYNILLEGKSEALENDVVIYMKQSMPAAISSQLPHDAAKNHFHHEGHRTVLSQHSLQAHADQWLGWTEIDGVGFLVAEVSPYEIDLEWGEINSPDEIAAVVADLGRATAMMHGAGDDDERHSELVSFSPEDEIHKAIGRNQAGFEEMLVDFSRRYGIRTREDHRIFVDLFRNGRIPGLPNSK